MIKKTQKFGFTIVLFLIISIFISLLIYISYCIKAGLKTTVMSKENITEVTDVINIKKRMEYHGCLVCWKNSKGVWLFNRNDEPCRLR